MIPQESLASLMRLLDLEEEGWRGLLHALNQEAQAVKSQDLEAINSSIQKKGEAISNLSLMLEEKRQLLNDIARRLNLSTPLRWEVLLSHVSPEQGQELTATATLDIEVESLLKGAQEMDLRLSTANSLFENPAWLLAGLYYLHSTRGRNMTVLMPYADALKDFTEWFAQLWAESLGKGGRGSTPIRALGAVDQHSQLQLYSEGPDDKLFTLLEVRETLGDLSIPFGCEEKSAEVRGEPSWRETDERVMTKQANSGSP